ncbi:MAG: glycosyltransferase family 4 protein [bacterium]|nr:glycosyltransferase family 4 protein [bacterium]
MHILLITIAYPPEIRSISIMLRELAEGLIARGHRVTVLTAMPRANLAGAAAHAVLPEDTIERGVRVLRVQTLPTSRAPYVVRGIAQLDLPRQFLRVARRHVRSRVDAVATYISPLPLARVGAIIARAHGARHLLNIQDIFPQNAIDLGIIRNRALIAYFERMERAAYANADMLTTHTPGSRRFLMERKGVSFERVVVVPNWIDCDAWDRVQATGAFRERYGLTGKFVIGFPGILGPAQHLDAVLDLAARVRDLSDIRFLLVGDGAERVRLMQRARSEGIANVQFEDFIDPTAYPAFVKELDLGLISLDPTYTTSMVPGKLTGFLAAGLPVLALLNPDNDGFDIIASAQCGAACRADDLDAAERHLRALHEHRSTLRAMGERGRAYAAAHYARDRCIAELERLLLVPARAGDLAPR